MVNYLKKLFWGVFIITFKINIGSISILPSFIGFMFIASAISNMYDEYKYESFNKAKDLANIAIILSFLVGLINLFSPDGFEHLLIIQIFPIIFMTMELLLFYNFFEGVSEYFYSENNIEMAEKYIANMKVYIIISIILIAILCFAIIFNLDTLVTLVLIIQIIITISIMIMINGLKNVFIEKDLEGNIEES